MIGVILLAYLINHAHPTGIFITQIILSCALLVAEILLYVRVISYYRELTDNLPKLTFKQFITLYNVNPSAWDLDYSNMAIYIDREGERRRVEFPHYIDYHLYLYMRWHRKKFEKRNKQLKAQADFVKQVQRDLAAQQMEIDELIKKELKKCGELINDG